VLQARYRWDVQPLPRPEGAFLSAAEGLGLAPRVAALLAGRGIADPAALERFLGPASAALHDPALLPDAAPFAERIEAAVQGHERVMVFGDFDADGLTGLAILVRVLRRRGLTVEPYVPSRQEEGHGLSVAAVERAVSSGTSLIVTVDCGTTNHAEIEAAGARGIDVLVTDHHRVPARLPPALAVVNPHRPDARYPDRELSGSGVAFKLGQLMLAGVPGGSAEALRLADLAVIGTIADVAPVLGENRAIARLGLDRLRDNPLPGLAALLRRAGVATKAVELDDLAFGVAPRLNAAGRVGEAMEAAQLLLTDDPAEADELADRLETANSARRELMRTVIAEARTSLDAVDDAPATIVRGPWPVGIVGLVAGRLADERGRPAIVGAELGDVIRASCRGDGALDLAAALERCSDLLVRHGGHAAAAGFEVQASSWDAVRARLMTLAAGLPPVGPPSVTVDLDLPGRAVDYALLRDLSRLAPCGPGHPEPLVLIRDLVVVRSREAAGGHTQLTVRRDPDVLDAIAFGWPELAGLVTPGDRVDVVARISSRHFGGFESLQLEIRDAAPAGAGAMAVDVARGTDAALVPVMAIEPADSGAEPFGGGAGPGLAPARSP
jgi:single-stranded-DNA-specific exonuclease